MPGLTPFLPLSGPTLAAKEAGKPERPRITMETQVPKDPDAQQLSVQALGVYHPKRAGVGEPEMAFDTRAHTSFADTGHMTALLLRVGTGFCVHRRRWRGLQQWSCCMEKFLVPLWDSSQEQKKKQG